MRGNTGHGPISGSSMIHIWGAFVPHARDELMNQARVRSAVATAFHERCAIGALVHEPGAILGDRRRQLVQLVSDFGRRDADAAVPNPARFSSSTRFGKFGHEGATGYRMRQLERSLERTAAARDGDRLGVASSDRERGSRHGGGGRMIREREYGCFARKAAAVRSGVLVGESVGRAQD